MKKVLALVLTAAMLLSCMIVGISAVREYSVEEVGGRTYKAAINDSDFGGESSYVKSLTNMGLSAYTAKIVFQSNSADFGNSTELVAFLAGSPTIHVGNGKIGMNGVGEVSYTFADATWYTVEWVVDGSSTTIKVNGEIVGTIGKAAKAQVYGTMYNAYVDEIAYYDADGDWVWGDDYEDGTDGIFAAEAIATFEEKGETVYTNNNVSYKIDKVAINDSDFAGESDYVKSLKNKGLSAYTAKIVFQSNAADFGNSTELVAFLAGSPTIHVGNGKIGMNGVGEVSYSFADATWYTVEWVVDGSSTTIKVNGETIGTISGAKNAQVYGTMYNAYVSEIAYYDANGNWVWGDDYEDGTDDIFAAEALTTVTSKGADYDLGMKYWDWNADYAYFENLNGSAKGVSEFSVDILFQTADSGFLSAWYADSVIITTSTVGNGSATVPYNFKTGVWYHVEYTCDGNGIDIYVDDAYVGTINGSSIFPNGICGQANLVSIDNLKIGNIMEDFEDGNFNAWSTGSNGIAMPYDFGIVEEKTLFDYIGEAIPDGDAKKIEAEWTSESEYSIYYHFPVGASHSTNKNYIVDFNLALIPNVENSEGAYFELWTDTANRRWVVGTKNTGRTEGEAMDLTLFDWGETTPDNFHRVTYVFLNGRTTIYVDEVEVYSNLSGSVWAYDGDNYEECLGSVWNGTAIIDNYKTYNSESYELLVDGLPSSGAAWHKGPKGTTSVTLASAADWCGINGHISGTTAMTTAPTCYSLGEYTTVCGVCGTVTEYNDIAMKAHNWASYDINRTTDTGLVYSYCKNSGCVEKRYTTLPAEYTGTLYEYYDMQDDLAVILNNGFAATCEAKYLGTDTTYITDCWTVTDNGELYFNDDAANYNEWRPDAYIPVNDWSMSMDITVTGVHETNDTLDDPSKSDPNGYAKEIYFWFGGNNGLVFNAGYNTENNTIFLRPDAIAGAAFIAKSAPFTMIEGEEYNFTVRYYYDKDENGIVSNPSVSLWIDGVKMLEYNTPDDAEYVVPMSADKINFIIFRDFAVNVLIDNMYLGSADLDLGIAYNCDLDGDCAVTAADALAMRMILVQLADADSVVNTHRVDTNGDGAINAKDQVTIRRAMA